MINLWLNAEGYGRASTGKPIQGEKSPQPDRHGSSLAKQVATEPKSLKFKVTVADGKVTIRDKRRT